MLKGSITIYLSLSLVIITALICTLVESGRISGLKAKAQSISYFAVDSTFSEYGRELFEDYGLMFLWCTKEDIKNKFMDYANYNCDMSKGIISKNADLFELEISEVEILEIERATDKGGDVFASQVSDYMVYAGIENILSEIMSQLNIFNQNGKVSKFYDKIQDFSDKLTKVEDSVCSIRENIDKIQNYYENPKSLVNEMLDQALLIENKINSEESFTVELREFKETYQKLKTEKSEVQMLLNDIEVSNNEYFEATDDAQMAVAEISDDLKEDKEDFDNETYDLLNEEVSKLEIKSTDNQEDFYGIKENKEINEKLLNAYSSLNEYYLYNTATLNSGNIEDAINDLKEIKKDFSETSFESLNVNIDNSTVKKEENSIIDYVNNIIDEGILGIVVEDVSNLSEENILNDNLPSILFSDSEGEDDDSIIDESIDKIILSEYLLSKFGNYLSPKENSKLKYEIEYILAGKSSDKENLSSVVKKIMLLREGSNLIYLLKDSKKRGEAYEMAMGIAGFTGMPILITITQFLILAAWALAESIIDVKNLLNGEEVNLMKSDSEWNLSLFGAKNLKNTKTSKKAGKLGALNYNDYLRVLLLMEENHKQRYRTMDLIQLNICKNYNSSFMMSDCISSISASFDYQANPVFTSFSFTKRLSTNKIGSYVIKNQVNYAY